MSHRRSVISAAALLIVSGCGGSDEAAPSATSTEAGAPSGQIDPELVGEWKRETTCEELVAALRAAGMSDVVDEFVAGNGFIPGVDVDDPEKIDVDDPCRRAVPRVHSHFFTAEGEFGSRDWNGERVDDGTYRADGKRLVISKEFPDVPFRYRVDGDTLTLDPALELAGCSDFRCGWSVAVAYPGKTWTRAGGG